MRIPNGEYPPEYTELREKYVPLLSKQVNKPRKFLFLLEQVKTVLEYMMCLAPIASKQNYLGASN